MDKKTNNLFSFATKELSQDAVICWILNWVNFPDSDLYELGCDLLHTISRESELPKEIIIHQQKRAADIVIVIPDWKQIIIIEDKVYSTEHDNQIAKYRDEYCSAEVQKEILKIESNDQYEVYTVYLKTGFFYDKDQLVKADYIVNWDMLYGIVSKPKYAGKSVILDDFVTHLSTLHSYYEEHERIDGKYDDREGYFLEGEYYTQYCLMRHLFPESMWDRKSEVYRVENGSSGGRPWTELTVANPYRIDGSEEQYYLFWRIDTNTKGPYLSFRLYEVFDKKDDVKRDRHKAIYDRLLEISNKTVNHLKSPLGLSWSDVKDRYSGNYYESALFTINLKEYLEKWEEIKTLLSEYVRSITDEIIKSVEEDRENGIL